MRRRKTKRKKKIEEGAREREREGVGGVLIKNPGAASQSPENSPLFLLTLARCLIASYFRIFRVVLSIETREAKKPTPRLISLLLLLLLLLCFFLPLLSLSRRRRQRPSNIRQTRARAYPYRLFKTAGLKVSPPPVPPPGRALNLMAFIRYTLSMLALRAIEPFFFPFVDGGFFFSSIMRC